MSEAPHPVLANTSRPKKGGISTEKRGIPIECFYSKVSLFFYLEGKRDSCSSFSHLLYHIFFLKKTYVFFSFLFFRGNGDVSLGRSRFSPSSSSSPEMRKGERKYEEEEASSTFALFPHLYTEKRKTEKFLFFSFFSGKRRILQYYSR